MRTILLLLAVTGTLLLAQEPPVAPAAPADNGPQAVVQQLFDAMSSHNPDAARALFAPDAGLFSLGNDGKSARMKYEEFVDLLASTKNTWLERIWNPTVLVHGPIAVVWAEYDFHLNGKLSHCGIDSFSLIKTAAGWKITSVADTSETSGCTSPLGPPTK
jgi:hypothetical protein